MIAEPDVAGWYEGRLVALGASRDAAARYWRRFANLRLAVFLLLVVGTGYLWRRTPTAFLPTEDKGYMALAVQLPDGASLQRTEEVVTEVEGILRKQPGVAHFVSLVGFSILGFSSQTNTATVFAQLKPGYKA